MALKVDPDKIRRLSLSEQQLEKAVASHGADVIRYFFFNSHMLNKRYILLQVFQANVIETSQYEQIHTEELSEDISERHKV